MEILICTLQSIKEVKNRALSLLSEAAHASMVQLGPTSLNMFKYFTSKKEEARNIFKPLTCSSHVFTNPETKNPELSIWYYFSIKMTVILAFFNLFSFKNENPYRTDKKKRPNYVKKFWDP